MSKSLFDNDQWTEKGTEISKELLDVMKPILQKYIDEDFSIRELMMIASEAANIFLIREVLRKRSKTLVKQLSQKQEETNEN